MIQIKKVGSQEIQDAVKANDGYCPCMRTKSPDTKCMCKEFREQECDFCKPVSGCEYIKNIKIHDDEEELQ